MSFGSDEMIEVSPLSNLFNQLVPLNDSDWEAVMEVAALKTVPAGRHFFRAGDTTPNLNFIIRGLGCHYYTKRDGSRFNKAFLQTGDVASSMESLQLGVPARFSCEALEDTDILSIPYSAMAEIALMFPMWRQLRELLIVRLALRKEAREADLLLLSPTERYQQFVENQPELTRHLANYHIASYLGISEVSLSRIRARLGVQNSYNKTE